MYNKELFSPTYYTSIPKFDSKPSVSDMSISFPKVAPQILHPLVVLFYQFSQVLLATLPMNGGHSHLDDEVKRMPPYFLIVLINIQALPSWDHEVLRSVLLCPVMHLLICCYYNRLLVKPVILSCFKLSKRILNCF